MLVAGNGAALQSRRPDRSAASKPVIQPQFQPTEELPQTWPTSKTKPTKPKRHNPYANNLAADDDADEAADDSAEENNKSLKQLYAETEFSADQFLAAGRLNRSRYIIYSLHSLLIGFIFIYLGMAIDAANNGAENDSTNLWILPGIIFTVVYVLHHAKRRLNDMGHWGIWTLLLTVPGLNALLLMILLLRRGPEQENNYGPAALAFNSLRRRIFGLLVNAILLVFVMSIYGAVR